MRGIMDRNTDEGDLTFDLQIDPSDSDATILEVLSASIRPYLTEYPKLRIVAAHGRPLLLPREPLETFITYSRNIPQDRIRVIFVR